MNVAALEAALPALTVTLLTGVDAVGQVSCADQRPTVRRTDVHVLWTLAADGPVTSGAAGDDLGGLGRLTHGLRYVVGVYAPSATQAQRRAWAEELRSGLHMRRRPTGVTGLDHAEVLSYAVGPGETGPGVAGGVGPVAVEAEVLFVGDV